MPLQRLWRGLAIAAVILLLGLGVSSAYAQDAVTNVPSGLRFAKDLGAVDPSTEVNITVRLKLNDKAAFDKAVDALYVKSSPTYHKWMTNDDLKKFAPVQSQRDAVRKELENHGLTILSVDPIGFSIRAHGTLGSVSSAFNTEIHQFERNGKVFRANVVNARLNGEAGDYVSSVAGIESHQVRPLVQRAINPRTKEPYAPVPLSHVTNDDFPPISTTQCLTPTATYDFGSASSLPSAVYSGTGYDLNELYCVYLPVQLQTAYGLNAVYEQGLNGTGETIVLVEGYGYPTIEKDANALFKLAGLPLLNKNNFSIVYPQGKPPAADLGILTGWNIEIALDVQSAHTIAPGANILVVATDGQDSEDFQNSINYVAVNNLGYAISNSYEEDLDLLSGSAEQTSWDDALEVATAKGISVNFSTGDGGDDGLGTPLGAAGVPSVAPHATAVGGTSILNDVFHPGSVITTSWGDMVTYVIAGGVLDPPEPLGLLGGGGGGESVYWPKPAWQSALPGKGRQTPDVSALADPYTGFVIVYTDEGEQYFLYGIGGTSLASPIFTAFWALADQQAGAPLGQAAPLIAGLPYGAIQDVLPTTDSSKYNMTGSITDSGGTTAYSADALFTGVRYGNTGFTSTVWELDPYDFLDFGFGIDSSLTVKKGWDNATGYGTPNGLQFIYAVTAP
jgi:subtilase family serine protease